MKQGYSSQSYIKAFLTSGAERLLDSDNNPTSLLSRPIPGTDYLDLTSVYPFAAGNEASIIQYDSRYVSIVGITNPLKAVDFSRIEGDVNVYKQHNICHLKDYSFDKLPTNYKRIIKKSNFNIHIIPNLNSGSVYLPLYDIYQNLVKRHGVRGTTNYTLEQIKCLLEAPGAVLVGNYHEEHGYIGFNLYYTMQNDVYLHISCQSDKSYELGANHQMTHESILFFKSLGFDRLLLGSTSDGSSSGEGLDRFKSSYSHCKRPNFIVTKVLNQSVYDKLTVAAGKEDSQFFPKYRG